jgi:LytS/YehU family sensor histidine kinase
MKGWIKIIVWSVFWIVSYFVLLSIFASSSEWQSIDHIYTLIFMATLIMAVASSEYYRRRLLAKKAYKMWAINLYGVIVIFAFFNQVLFDKLIDFILPGYYFISYYTFFNLLEFFGAFVGLATLISLSMEWFQLQELRKEKSIAEFKALVNQVNPHFLFNGLTVLYTLSLKDNKETSSAIIKLSDILRYVIYQSSANSVSVASEAAILRDYIDLQRYRVHPTTQIDFTEEISTNETAIAPMLFLPLVENAFKHGVHGETQNAFVRMTLREHGGVVNFTITNNRSQINTTPGIGLKNLRERLKLTYPDNHSFVITETDTMYTVNMQVTI